MTEQQYSRATEIQDEFVFLDVIGNAIIDRLREIEIDKRGFNMEGRVELITKVQQQVQNLLHVIVSEMKDEITKL